MEYEEIKEIIMVKTKIKTKGVLKPIFLNKRMLKEQVANIINHKVPVV